MRVLILPTGRMELFGLSAALGALFPAHQFDTIPEDFLTRDAAYLSDDCSACTAWHALPPWRAKSSMPEWIREQRELHPKAFMAWLCRDPSAKKCSRYRET